MTRARSEEVLVDVNQLAEGQPFMALGALSVSADGNLLAYTTDNTGFRQYTLHIKDLRTGEMLPDTAERVGAHRVDARLEPCSSTPSKTSRPSGMTACCAMRLARPRATMPLCTKRLTSASTWAWDARGTANFC